MNTMEKTIKIHNFVKIMFRMNNYFLIVSSVPQIKLCFLFIIIVFGLSYTSGRME